MLQMLVLSGTQRHNHTEAQWTNKSTCQVDINPKALFEAQTKRTGSLKINRQRGSPKTGNGQTQRESGTQEHRKQGKTLEGCTQGKQTISHRSEGKTELNYTRQGGQ